MSDQTLSPQLPGQPSFENGNGNGQAAMMPPPQPALGLSIPPNIGGIPTDMDMNMITSPGGTISRAAPEPNKRALYVGGLDPRVTEDVLKQIFETTGHVQNVKIIPDKNVSQLSHASSVQPHSHVLPLFLPKHFTAASHMFRFDMLATSCVHTQTGAPHQSRSTATSLTHSLVSSSPKATTTASLSTTTQAPPNAQCRPSMEDVCTSKRSV